MISSASGRRCDAPAAQRAVVRDLGDELRCRALRERGGFSSSASPWSRRFGARQRGAEQHAARATVSSAPFDLFALRAGAAAATSSGRSTASSARACSNAAATRSSRRSKRAPSSNRSSCSYSPAFQALRACVEHRCGVADGKGSDATRASHDGHSSRRHCACLFFYGSVSCGETAKHPARMRYGRGMGLFRLLLTSRRTLARAFALVRDARVPAAAQAARRRRRRCSSSRRSTFWETSRCSASSTTPRCWRCSDWFVRAGSRYGADTSRQTLIALRARPSLDNRRANARAGACA